MERRDKQKPAVLKMCVHVHIWTLTRPAALHLFLSIFGFCLFTHAFKNDQQWKSHPGDGAGQRLGEMTISTSCSTTHLNFVSRTKHVSRKQAPHCVTTINSACYQHQIQQQATDSASYFYNATVFTPASWIVETKVQPTVTVSRLITRPPRGKCRNKAPKISFARQELK